MMEKYKATGGDYWEQEIGKSVPGNSLLNWELRDKSQAKVRKQDIPETTCGET